MPIKNPTPALKRIAEKYPAVLLDAFEQPDDDHEAELFFCQNECMPGYCWCEPIGEPLLHDPVGLIDHQISMWPAYDKMDAEIRPWYDYEPDSRNEYYDEENQPPEMIYSLTP